MTSVIATTWQGSTVLSLKAIAWQGRKPHAVWVTGRVLTAARVQNGDVTASSVYTYDAVGRTTSTVRTGPGGGDANYSYTSAGRLSGASWSTGMQVAYSYNQVGELTTVTLSGTGGVPAVEYGYDPSGRVSTVTRQAGTPVVTSAVYDAAGQLSSLQHSTSAGVLKGYAITRDVRGNPTQVDTTTQTGTTSALYSYDAVSRLRTECYPATGTACVAKSPRNAYTYDLVGNRTSQTARTVTGNHATTVVTDYAYDAAYELLTESVAGTPTVTNTWTANGALATSTTPAGTQTYTTDLTDELISLELADGSTVGYTHDAQGNRTSRTVDGLLDASWAWDDLSSLPMRVGEYDASGTLATAWLADPTSSTGASLAQTSGGVGSWLLSDPFANTVATVSTTGGTVSGTRTMDAFGVERTAATGSLADAAVGFAGQYLDDATGLYDMRARDYDPSSGRFNATDPVAVPTGMPYAEGYSYARNNPLTLADPTGLFCIPLTFAGKGDCRSIGERISPKSDTNAGLIDGLAKFVTDTGYAASPEGVQAGWSAFQQDRKQNGTWAAIFNSAGNGATGALAINDFTAIASCGTGPVICSEHDLAASAAHAGLTLAQTELLLTASLFGPEAGYCKALLPAASRTAVGVARPTIVDLLMPAGSAIGTAGTNATIRVITGGLPEARTMFSQLTQGGRIVSQTPSLTRVLRPDGGIVQLRTVMTKSPVTAATIDVNVPGIPITKIKFNP